MKLLLNRELLRQAPAAAGMLGLGVLLLLVLWATTLLADRPGSMGGGFVEAVFLIVAVGTPWLLSTTAVAPDQETGAEAFLVTMPVERGRLAIMRGAVALGMSVSVLAITAVMCALAAPLFGSPGYSRNTDMMEMVVVGLIAGGVMFTAGSLATVLVRQTLVAFVAAPALAAAPAAAYFWVSKEVVGLPKDLSAAVIGVSLPTLLLIAAWRGYTRPTRELGWRRPTRFALGVTGALFLTCAGLSTTALALDRLIPIYHGNSMTVRSPNGASASILTSPRSRFHWRYSGSVATLAPARTFVFRADAPDTPIEMMQGLVPVSFSPDGSKLLGRLPNGELVWTDLDTNEQRRGMPPKQAQGKLDDRRHSLGFHSWGHYWDLNATYLPVLWHAGVPWIAHRSGLSQWDGRASRNAPAGTQVMTAHGRRALAVTDDGRVTLLDLGAKEPVRLAPPPGTRPMEWTMGGPQGRYVVTLARDQRGACSLWATDTDTANTPAWRKLDANFPEDAVFGVGELRNGQYRVRPPWINLSFSPFGPFVSCVLDVNAFSNKSQPFRTIDLRTGASAVVHDRGQPVHAVTDWRPDGHLLTSAGTWDPTSGTLTPYTEGRSALVDQQGALLFSGKHVIHSRFRFNTETGKPDYRPLFSPR